MAKGTLQKTWIGLMTLLVMILACQGVKIKSRAGGLTPRFAFQVDQNLPSFVHLKQDKSAKSWSMTVSSFTANPLANDHVYQYPRVSDVKTFVELNNSGLNWPNEVSSYDSPILGGQVDPFGGLVVAGGFLVPLKTAGALTYFPYTDAHRNTVSSVSYNLPQMAKSQPNNNKWWSWGLKKKREVEDTNWFYHRTEFADLTGDGQTDFVTCRTYKPIFGSTQQQLVIYSFPGNGKVVEHVLSDDGCDVFFQVVDIDNDGRLEILAAAYFSSKLTVFWSEDPKNNFLNDIKSRIVATDMGQVFDLRIYDFEGDGTIEIAVTNHQTTKETLPGTLWLMTVPKDFKTGPSTEWKRRVVYDKFPVVLSGSTQAAPGAPVIFYPTFPPVNQTLPFIAVAGDGASAFYVFAANGTEAMTADWKLIFEVDYDKVTVGGIAVADVNYDGYAELFVPLYEANRIDVYTMAPSSAARPFQKVFINN